MGTYVDSKDEANVRLQHTNDALGRLIHVAELGTSSLPKLLRTDYAYTDFGDLANVSQSGVSGETSRARSFNYDSLSRLISSHNPETGTICYGTTTNGQVPDATGSNCSFSTGYDANGNLLRKTDSRGSTTSYTYDSLNRLTSKSRSGGSTDQYFYDGQVGQSAVPALVGLNIVGRMSFAHSFNPDLTGTSCDINGAKKCDDQYYGYDAMGRPNHLIGARPSEWGTAIHTVDAGYDLAGNLIDLTYPDGTQVAQHYDSAGRVDWVKRGTSQNPGAAFVSSIAYSPSGAPTTTVLGNGVTEHMTQNSRLQPCEINAFMPLALGGMMFMDRQMQYSPAGEAPCDPAAGNNGNIWHIRDATNPPQGSTARNQNFQYDTLNRLTHWDTALMAGQSRSQDFAIDSFGNMSAQSGSNPVYTFGSNNRISNLPCASAVTPYDDAGNQLCSTGDYGSVVRYSWDAESRLTKIAALNSEANPFVRYTYDAEGARARKDNGDGTWTEYIYFNGQPIAEKSHLSSGSDAWTNYVYANGEKIARVQSTNKRLRLSGINNPTSDSGRWTVAILPMPSNVTIGSGDTLNFRMYQHNAADKISLGFTDGSNSDWYCSACAHPVTDADQWKNVSIQIGAGSMIGKTISYYFVGNVQGGPNGAWDVMIADIALLRPDGSIVPFPVPLGSVPYGGDMTDVSGQVSISEEVTGASGAAGVVADTHYYLGDHLGTTQMELSAGGWPVWKGEFGPLGQELDTQSMAMHYKFTGKERDTESGLDYFGARYYSSNMGRFSSPDSGVDQDVSDPQSWNLYGYVRNNPVTKTDEDGRSVTICSANSFGDQQCRTISDEAYSAAQQAANSGGLSGPSLSNLQNSSTGAGSITDSSGATVGSVQWTPDNPGIQGPQAIQAFGQIARDGNGAIKWFGQQMAYNALGGVAGRGVGLAVEAVQASRAAGALAEVLAKAGSAVGNTGFKVASRELAEQAAKEWVGEGWGTLYANRGTGQAIGKISADGTKVARYTSAETKGYINLVNKTTGSNLHVRW